MLATGTILDNKYRLDRPIGRGGMGMVWRAERLGWQAPVAIKLVHLELLRVTPEAPLRPALVQRFFSEASTAAAIRSPHVVQILDHGVDPTLGLPFIVMELLEGETLEQRLNRELRLSADLIVHLFNHVARALSRLHEAQMVHRDLKPSNIFLTKNDEELVVKLLDFGITKAHPDSLSEAPITATGEQLGTPFYMSPEQIRGSKQIDHRTDIWAMGVIAFECFTGQRPFEGDTLGDLTLKICVEPLPLPSGFAPVPEGFDQWFLRAASRDRDQTFGSVREAVDALKLVATPATMTPALASPVPTRTKARRLRLLALGASLGLVTAAFGLTTFNRSNAKSALTPAASHSPNRADSRTLSPLPSGSTVPDTARNVATSASSAALVPMAPVAAPGRASVSSPPSRAATTPRPPRPAAAASSARSSTAPPAHLLESRL